MPLRSAVPEITTSMSLSAIARRTLSISAGSSTVPCCPVVMGDALLLEAGASVVFTDVDEERLKAAAPEGDPRAATCRADVAEPTDAQDAVDMAVRTFGSIDVLVNNAGIVGWTDFADTTIEQWNRVIDVNVTGMFRFAQAAAASMRSLPRDPQRACSIINVASVEGHVAMASSGHPQVHYNASKGAVVMLTRALAVELAPDGIRVNA